MLANRNIKLIIYLSAVLVLILVIIGIIFIVNGKYDNSIVGEWKYIEKDYIYTFKKDGTGKYYALGTVMTFTYEVEKNEVSILYKGEEIPKKCKFSIQKDTLTIDDDLGKGTVYKRSKSSKKVG